MQIDIGEGIPHELMKIFGKNKKSIFLIYLNEFNLKDSFENYIVAKSFYAPSNDKKIWKKRKIHNPIYYINPFVTLFLN